MGRPGRQAVIVRPEPAPYVELGAIRVRSSSEYGLEIEIRRSPESVYVALTLAELKDLVAKCEQL